MSFNQYEPYGPVVPTTMRIVTWNVWGRHGHWAQRQAGIEEALVAAAPDPGPAPRCSLCWTGSAGPFSCSW